MSENRDPTRSHPPSPGDNDPNRKPISEVLPASGVSELLARLDEHRGRGARHVVGERIATGGMGEILKVTDQDLGRDLAMKVLRRDFAALGETDRARMLARFLEEAQVTGQLHHPSIVPVHELSIGADGQPYFTMPLIRGWDFGEIIHFVRAGQQGWTLARALGIVLKVCEAVAYAHARGVIHRDIKPSNVRVGRFGETYLMDWGLARVLGRKDARDIRVRDPAVPRSTAVRTERSKLKLETPDSPLITMDGDVVGTPNYMSPEQARGDTEHVGLRSDVYSVGALLYHLLAGVAPYAPSEGTLSPRAVWSLVLDGPPKDLHEVAPDIAEELVDICRKAMARDARERYADAQEMALDIEAFLDRRPVKAHAPTLSYALRLAYERNRRVVRVAMIGVGLLLVATTYFVVRLSDTRSAEARARTERTDSYAATSLLHEEDTLYPVHPDRAQAMNSWCTRVEDLLSRRPAYEARAGESPQSLALVGQMEALSHLLPKVRERWKRSTDLKTESIDSFAAAWAAAESDIQTSANYHKFSLHPQVGLRPLWKNPCSGLWEFLLVGSGEAPVVEDKNGKIDWREQDGIVLVLLPTGDFEMGSSPDDIHERIADSNETLHDESVLPFFIGKTETTQAQWLRVMERNPSRCCPEETNFGKITALHPVESVSWEDCMKFCGRIGTRLPSEAEWEYACRAGTSFRYIWGDEPESLKERENVLDLSASKIAPAKLAPWDDHFMVHAPVGTFEPNPFGLSDMLGNVSEWCSDEFFPNLLDKSNPTVARCTPFRAIRGGNFYSPLRNSEAPQRTIYPLRCAFRQWDLPYGLTFMRGVRIARSIE